VSILIGALAEREEKEKEFPGKHWSSKTSQYVQEWHKSTQTFDGLTKSVAQSSTNTAKQHSGY
jgi:hypothetical protein